MKLLSPRNQHSNISIHTHGNITIEFRRMQDTALFNGKC